MFSSLEYAVNWARSILGYRTSTYVPRDADGMALVRDKKFCIVERTGGELDYPHDMPSFSFQIWSQSEADAEADANILAIATKTKPMDDYHINACGTPSVLSYGLMDGGWFVWQVNLDLNVNLLDK